MVNKGNIRDFVDMERIGVYRIFFIFEEAGRQYVDISFNEEVFLGKIMKIYSVYYFNVF